jgi:hypothetical protein
LETKNPLPVKGAGYLLTAVFLVPLAGIELATFSLRMNCSTD